VIGDDNGRTPGRNAIEPKLRSRSCHNGLVTRKQAIRGDGLGKLEERHRKSCRKLTPSDLHLLRVEMSPEG
jgi:hypothetical protein